MISPSMVGPIISVSSSAGWLGSGREKVVCKRASAAVERTASAILLVGGTYLGRDECDTVTEEPGVGQVCCTPKGVKVKAEIKYCGERGTVSVP